MIVPLLLSGCGAGTQEADGVAVAAASNLTEVFGEIAKRFEAAGGPRVRLSFGSTAQLAQQIQNGAPFDVFAAADVEHAKAVKAARVAVYARGRVALWLPRGPAVESLAALARVSARHIALPRPESAPYGRAAVEALRRVGIWEVSEPKIVYAQNVSMAKQFAQSGNAEAAFTAYSLVFQEPGTVLLIDETLHAPVEQALALLRDRAGARQFFDFVLSDAGQTVLRAYRYEPAPTALR